MSGFVALQQPGSLLMPMVPFIMRTMQISGTMLVSESHAATGGLLIWGPPFRAMVTFRPGLLLRTLSGSLYGTITARVCVATRGYTEAWDLGCNL